MLSPRAHRVVVILAHPSQTESVRPWLAQFPSDRVHVLSAEQRDDWGLQQAGARHHRARSLRRIANVLRALPSIDVLVTLVSGDLLPKGAGDQLELYDRLMRFIRKGGIYVLDRAAAPDTASDELAPWLRVLAAADDDVQAIGLAPSEVRLARHTGAVEVSADLVIAQKATKHYVKVHHTGADRVLRRRERDLAVTKLATIDKGSMRSRASVFHHGAGPLPANMPETIEYPRMHLRHYQGDVALAGSTLTYTGHSILPDSFRWPLHATPNNILIRSRSRVFAQVPPDLVPTRRLEGSYYQLDCIHSGHFGHLMTEMVCRLWGWERAKQEIPDLKAFFHLPPGKADRHQLATTLFSAYGIEESDVVWVTTPVWVDSLVAATPMWHNARPFYAHPGITDVWDRLSEGLLRDAEDVETPDRIFVSRGARYRRRTCRNIGDVESAFTARGFSVVYPEELDLARQAQLFANAEVIAGFGGSAMFNLMHARKAQTVIVLNHDAYIHRNEHLFTSLIGGDVHYFWSAADSAHPEGGFSRRALRSGWDFDFERNGAELEQLLRSL